jgi:hypothetical protein
MVPAAVARYHLQGVNRGAVSLGFNDRVVVISGFGAGSPEDQARSRRACARAQRRPAASCTFDVRRDCVIPRRPTPQTRYMAQVEGFWRQLGLNPAAYAAAKERLLKQEKQPQPPGPASSPTQPPAS